MDIVVTGEREKRPDATTTGSRIASDKPAIFIGIASKTGIAGLTPERGMDPLAGPTRKIKQIECRTDDRRLSAPAACRLAAARQSMAAGSYADARAAIDRFIASETASDAERYLAAKIWYELGEIAGDASDREHALKAMLATEEMPAVERPSALRTLVSMALRQGDRTAAIAHLERLLPSAPTDARSRANLAVLYSETSRAGEAVGLMRQAIEIATSQGQFVPEEWHGFVADPKPKG